MLLVKSFYNIIFFIKTKVKITNYSKFLLIIYAIFISLVVIVGYLPSLFLVKIFIEDNFLYPLIIFFISLITGKAIVIFVSTYIGEHIKIRIDNNLKETLINQFIKQDLSIFANTNIELLSHSLTKQVRSLADNYVIIVEGFTWTITSLVYSFIFLSFQHYSLVLFSVVTILIWVSLNFLIRKKNIRLHSSIRENEEMFSIYFSKLFANVSMVKLINNQEFLNHQINNLKDTYFKSKKKFAFLKVALFVTSSVMFGLMQLGLIGLAQLLLNFEKIKPNAFTGIVYISGMFLAPVSRIVKMWEDIAQKKAMEASIKEKTFNWKDKRLTSQNIIKKKKLEYIKVDKLTYKWDNKILFKNLSFEVNEGDILKINGDSGVGKTTLISQIIGITKIQSGSIKFNDDLNIEDLKIGWISQKPFIFPLSILDNLTLKNKNIKLEDVEFVLDKVGLSYLKDKLKNKIDFNYSNLSGGELRRIEIARMILLKPQLLILDEPFNGIDKEKIVMIKEFIKARFRNSIILYISHELEDNFSTKQINLIKLNKNE